ncbi:MAG: chemotaxis protein CheD [Planctomycetota bacterium]|jgi:chemotaxis protein CheD
MKQIVDVATGEVKIGRGKTTLRSVAIGSCIAVAAYDFKEKIGALAHVMLPGRAPKDKISERTKYAADAIDLMIADMTRAGANEGDIEVYLVGGANVLKRDDDTVCKNNIESVTRLLDKSNIPVRASILGGTKRKGVLLDVESGCVSYTEADEREKLLWRST